MVSSLKIKNDFYFVQFKTRKRTTDPQRSLITCPKTWWKFWARRTRSRILTHGLDCAHFFFNTFQVSNCIFIFFGWNSSAICTDECQKIEWIIFSVSCFTLMIIKLTFNKVSNKYYYWSETNIDDVGLCLLVTI